ncbi:MAG TPA: hypothetical protein VFX13_08120 [Gaiellales bacterium]|nr:hypothetical protein [Gaiellales bacterium]
MLEAERCGEVVHGVHPDRGHEGVRGGVVGDRQHQQVELGQGEPCLQVHAFEQAAASGHRRVDDADAPLGSTRPAQTPLQNAAETSTLIVLAAGSGTWASRSWRRPLETSTAATAIMARTGS